MVDAKRSDAKWPGIFTSTTGMVFLRTPFRGTGGLNQSEILQAAQSQYEEGQVHGAILNILAPSNESLTDLIYLFFETRQEKNKAQVAYFFEQKSSNVRAILGRSRIQVCEGSHIQCTADVKQRNLWSTRIRGASIRPSPRRSTPSRGIILP